MCLVGTVVRGLSFVEPIRVSGPCSSAFCIDDHCYCACSGTSVNIDGYMQGAGEHGGDAGFLGHVAGWVMAVYTPLGLDWWLRFLGCTGGYLWFLRVVIGATRTPMYCVPVYIAYMRCFAGQLVFVAVCLCRSRV